LRSTRSKTSTDRYKTGTPVTAGAYNKAQVLPPASGDLHVVRRTIRTYQNAFALCEKRKEGKNSQKNNFPRMLLLAESSLAIDAQQDKHSSLQDWHPGHSRCIQQSTSLATCFW
jgi:hypothetical protein